MVLAETLILLMGRIDLSLESTFGLAPGVAAWLTVAPGVAHGLGWIGGAWAVPICLLVGALVGAVNGLLIVRFQLSGFIVTLGMLITLRGLLDGISKGQTFFQLPASMTWLGQTLWWRVPVSVWLSLALFAVGIFVARLHAARPGALRDRRQRRRGEGGRHPHRPRDLVDADHLRHARRARRPHVQRSPRLGRRRAGERLHLHRSSPPRSSAASASTAARAASSARSRASCSSS